MVSLQFSPNFNLRFFCNIPYQLSLPLVFKIFVTAPHHSLPVSVDYLHILDDMRRYIAANVLIDPLILLSKIKVPHYTGAAFRHSIKQTLTTEPWDLDNINLLADENSKVLMEEAENKIFFEEVTANGT